MTTRHGVNVGIVAHNARGDQAAALADQVGAVYRSVDNGTLGCRNNHTRVWRHLSRYNTLWTVVLEDDAVPCDDFTHQLTQALTTAPTPVVSLYLGTSRPASWQSRVQQATIHADQTHAPYITFPRLLHAVAVAIRTDLIADMLHHLQPGRPIDNAISHWALNRHRITYTWPSLVDHADGPTLVNHSYNPHAQPRRAWRTAHHTL